MEAIAPWRRWLAVIATVSAAAMLFWGFEALPFQDLPAHAGLIALRHRLAGSPFEQRYFALSPQFGPYSLFRWTGDLLAGTLGPVGSVRLLMTLPVVALPAALGWARQRLRGDGAVEAAFVGACLALGFLTLLGFASYLLGVAALVVAYALWHETLDAARRGQAAMRSEVAFGAWSGVVLLLHGYAFVVLVGLGSVMALAAPPRKTSVLRLRALVPALALGAFMFWQDRTRAPPAVAPQGMPPGLRFAGPLDKAGLLATPTLMTRWGVDLLAAGLLWLVLGAALVATARADARATGDAQASTLRTSLAALAALCGAFVALPRSIGWFGFVDGRLVPLALVVAALAVDRAAMPRWVRLGWERGIPGAAICLVALAWTASYRFQAEAAGWRDVLSAVPPRSSLLNLPVDPGSDVFAAHPFVHYDKLALAERPLVVSDVWFHQGTALYPRPDNPALRLPPAYSESDLGPIDWPTYRLEDWDYVLLRTRPGGPAPAVPAALALVIHRGGWWLYRAGRAGAGPTGQSNRVPAAAFAFTCLDR